VGIREKVSRAVGGEGVGGRQVECLHKRRLMTGGKRREAGTGGDWLLEMGAGRRQAGQAGQEAGRQFAGRPNARKWQSNEQRARIEQRFPACADRSRRDLLY
jgi:hypothetical protein